MNLTKTRNTTKYLAIKELSDENKTYSISALCEFAGIARSAYYKWLGHVNSDNDNLNERIANTITKIHDEHPDMGYRRIRDTLAHDYKIAVNDKRVLRICRKKKIQSYIKHRYNCCTKPASDPAYVAENILNREFKSDMINQKWVTDVSEFKYGVGEDDKKGKLYLSVILDLCDRRPVAFVYSTRNDNPLVFDTFDKAVAANPGATPLLHSDRGYQYTSKAFRRRILAAGMTQSMSRVARCIDNGPMEGFWGLMKREMYYGKKYKTKEELQERIDEYFRGSEGIPFFAMKKTASAVLFGRILFLSPITVFAGLYAFIGRRFGIGRDCPLIPDFDCRDATVLNQLADIADILTELLGKLGNRDILSF